MGFSKLTIKASCVSSTASFGSTGIWLHGARAGHQYGLESEEYKTSLETADYHIGRVIEALQDRGIYDNTLIVVTTDHSLQDTSHSRGPTFSIWNGPGIKQGYEMDDASEYVSGYGWVSHTLDDVAPTITELLCLRSPVDATGTGFADQILVSEAIIEEETEVVSIDSLSVTGPYREGMRDVVLLGVEVLISDVVDLKEWQFRLDYDEEILALWDIRLDPDVIAQTGGSSRNGPVHTVPRPFSGSRVLLRYYFKPLKVGVSEFRLYDVVLKDLSGDVLPSSVSSSHVTVTAFSDWVDGEFELLSREFDVLSEEFEELNQTFASLQDKYASLESDLSESVLQIVELESIVARAHRNANQEALEEAVLNYINKYAELT